VVLPPGIEPGSAA